MTTEINKVLNKISDKVSEQGFLFMEEFSAVDSLLHKDEMLAVYSVEKYNLVAEALSHDAQTFYMEVDYEIKVRLLGKACDFVDYKDFADKCEGTFLALAGDSELLFRGLKITNAVQSLPLKRLEKDISMTVRVMQSLGVV